MGEKKAKKMKPTERVGTDWNKIEKEKTPEKKKSKKKKKEKKPESSDDDEEEYEEHHDTKFGNMHEKDNKVIKADNSKWDNDWDKINAKRAEIKAIKEKKRMSKLQRENDLKLRNQKKKETDKKFKNA